MLKIELEIIYANKTTIYFKSKMLLNLIGTIQVFIPINITNFYIIDILIPFFFCLKNINILSIYLNNIIN